MTKLYLTLLLAIAGCALAFPPRQGQGHYVVTWDGNDELFTGNDEAASYRHRELLGRKLCTRGPAYWCHNITHAAQCHAMEHCINKVWVDPKEKLPADNDSVCEVCLDMVKQARDQLLSNETQDELRQVLEGSCNLIPLKIVSKECRQLADDFIPELIDALTSRMDPQMVCHISGLCNSKRIDDMLAAMSNSNEAKPLDPVKIDTCPTCEYYIGESAAYLKKLTKKDLRIKLLNICGYLGSYSDACRQGVIHELDAIYEFIKNNDNPKEICSLVGLCTEAVDDGLHRVPLSGGQQQAMTGVRVWQPPQGNKEDLECDFCKQLTVSVRNWLVANATEEEFQQVLKGLCKNTGKYKDECQNLAEQYGQQLYQVLVNDLNPDELCKAIGVCQDSLRRVQLVKDNAPVWTILKIDDDKKTVNDDDSSSEETEDDSDDIIPLMKLVPGERLAGDDEIKKPNDKSKQKCEFCQYALHYLQQYLDDSKTEEEIKDKVDRLCDEYIPKAFVDQCKVFVEEYGDGLVTLLAQEIDPTEVCPRLRLCPAKPTQTRATTEVGDILPTCAICTFTIEKIIDLTGKNLTKESIDHAMESICSVVPRNERENCMGFMKNYGDQVAEMIVIYGTSHGVCAALHLCILAPAPTQPPKIVVDTQLPMDRYLPQTVVMDRVSQIQAENVNDDSRKCVICEFVITTLDERLQDNATEEEIKAEVEHICTYLPKTVQGRCQTFVDLYGEEVIQYLSQEVDPAEICQRIKLCQPSTPSFDAVRKLDMDQCQLCMLVSNYLRTLVDEEEADQDINRVANRTCAIVPQSYRQQCKAMIEDYGSYLIGILSKETDNGKACKQIQLCPTTLTAEVEDNSIEEDY